MKNRKINEQKGITLIALVITIIVMLILVSVTITIAVNGGLFEYAKKAHDETIDAREKEQSLGLGKAKVEGKFATDTDLNVIVRSYTEE